MNHTGLAKCVKSYDPNCDEAKIDKAIDFAMRYHGAQLRESGEPYYYHPLAVAEIIAKMKLDSESVITALLHDAIEDTDLTLKDIEEHFGHNVAKLVDGVTKLSKIEFKSYHVRQAEDFRKLLLAMSEDIRVLLVKLADRLHNIRTIDCIKSEEKRTRIALETMELYAPLAERIGIQQIKTELQDICFKVLYPEARDSIQNRLNQITVTERDLVEKIVTELKDSLQDAGISAQVYGRTKTAYSIWIKIQQKNIGLDQLSDIIAFRIIVNNVQLCYRTLGVIHTKYQMVPGNFQDFISTPKNNGYQSLHTVIIGPFQQKVEVQIRTYDMHDVAELGVAAHWRYKQRFDDATDGSHYRWIQELLSILDTAGDPEDFLQNTKLAMYYDQVFCFTPNGNLVALPRGATIIDFAYAVHSNVGNHCVGAKVNGRIVPLRSGLNNGDQVEIITSKNKTPSIHWEKFVVTGKARAEIKRFIRTQHKEQYIHLGRAIAEKTLRSHNITEIDNMLEKAVAFFKKQSVNDVLYDIASGSITRDALIKLISPHFKQNRIVNTLSLFRFRKTSDVDLGNADNNAVSIHGLIPGMAIHFATCCNPTLSDSIKGVMHTGNGIAVHTSNCTTLNNISTIPDSILPLTWDADNANTPFVCRLKVALLNETGSLATLCTLIAKEEANILNFKITNRSTGVFELILDIEVINNKHIENIIKALKSEYTIPQVERCQL